MQRKDGRYRTASSQATMREQVVEYLKKERGTQKQAAANIWIKYSVCK